MSNKQMSAEEMRKLGGEAKFKKVGSEGMAEMGKKGGDVNKAKGSEYFKRIRAIGIAKKKKAQKVSPVDRFTNILTGNRG